MVYNLVSSAEIVARISDDYNINHADYINRVPQWVHQAINELDVKVTFIPKHVTLDLVDRIALLPKDVKWITGVEGDGCRLTRITGVSTTGITELDTESAIIMTNLGITVYGTDTTIDSDTNSINTISTKIRTFDNSSILTAPTDDKYNYILLPNGKIELNKDYDSVTIYYLSYPISFDDVFGFDAPMIPDNEQTKVALTWYVLAKILMRGYKHPVLKLGNTDPEYDPSKQWTKWKLIARNNLSEGDSEQNDIISDIYSSYFYIRTL